MKLNEPNLVIPRLPPEIECLIFEIAAQSAEISNLDRVNLLLVSKRTTCWIEPIVYKTLVYNSTAPQPGGPLIPRQSPPTIPSSKFHFVQHISFSRLNQTPTTYLREILLACFHVTTLLLWFAGPSNFAFNFILEGNLPLLKRLSIMFHEVSTHLFNGPDAPRRLRTLGLTHLELIGPALAAEMYSFLTHIPHITHLGFFGFLAPSGTHTPHTVFRSILASPLGPRLKVFTAAKCHVHDAPRRECFEKYEETGIEDVRFVYQSDLAREHMKDRLRAMNGTAVGIWEFAEEIIEKRKRKLKEAVESL